MRFRELLTKSMAGVCGINHSYTRCPRLSEITRPVPFSVPATRSQRISPTPKLTSTPVQTKGESKAPPDYTYFPYLHTGCRYTWNFVSHIAAGGEALPDNGLTPVWEPFILTYNNQLVIYYSDQRDPLHGQKLVHQTSTDLHTWAAPVDDVAYSNYTFRPGMTTVAELPSGQYVMTYEFYGAPEADFAVYYRMSDDPLNFNAAAGQVVRASDGVVPTSSPYVIWSPVGGPNGTIVVSSGNDEAIFLNRELGQSGAWTRVDTPAGMSYTRSLRVLPAEQDILIVGGGVLSGSNNSVQVTVVDITLDTPPFTNCTDSCPLFARCENPSR